MFERDVAMAKAQDDAALAGRRQGDAGAGRRRASRHRRARRRRRAARRPRRARPCSRGRPTGVSIAPSPSARTRPAISTAAPTIAAGQWDLVIELIAPGRAAVPLQEPRRLIQSERNGDGRNPRSFDVRRARATPAPSHMTLAVEGVACAGCIRKIESGLAKLPGVIDARLNFTQRRLAVDWRDDEIDAARIIAAVEGIGYHAHPFAPERVEADESAQAKWLLKCLAVAGFAAMNVMLLSVSVWAGNVSDMTQETRDLFHWLSALIALPAAAYAGQPFFQSALTGAARAPAQHGRADLARRDAGARPLGLRDRDPRRACLFRFRDHAVVLSAVRPLSRSGDAAEDAAVRRQSRVAEGGVRRTGSMPSGELTQRAGRRAACPATACWCGRANAFPPTAPSSTAPRRSTRAW